MGTTARLGLVCDRAEAELPSGRAQAEHTAHWSDPPLQKRRFAPAVESDGFKDLRKPQNCWHRQTSSVGSLYLQ